MTPPRPPPPPPRRHRHTPPATATAIAMASSGDGQGPRYLDPDHVFELFVDRRLGDLVDYIDSFPGAADDMRCHFIKALAKYQILRSVETVPAKRREEFLKALFRARKLAQECSLVAPQNIADVTNATSNPVLRHSTILNQGSDSSLRIPPATGLDEHYNDPPNSSSYNGKLLNNQLPGSHVLRCSSTLNQGSGSSLETPSATFIPLQANSNDGQYMDSFDSSSYAGRMPISSYVRRMQMSNMTQLNPNLYSGRKKLASHVPDTVDNNSLALDAMPNQPSAPNSVSNYNPRYAAMLNQTSASNLQANSNNAPAVGVLPLGPPGPEQFAPQNPIENAQAMPTADGEEERLVSYLRCLLQQDRIARLSVASLLASDGTEGFGGVVLCDSMGQFICALCFPVPCNEKAIVFAAACCEAIRIAMFFSPSTILLESHLFPLLKNVNRPEVETLMASLRQVQGRICEISEESNGAACQFAMHARFVGKLVFGELPDWLVLN